MRRFESDPRLQFAVPEVPRFLRIHKFLQLERRGRTILRLGRTGDLTKKGQVGTQNNRRIQIVRWSNDGFLEEIVEHDSDCVPALTIGVLVYRGANCSVFDEWDHLLKQVGSDETKLAAPPRSWTARHTGRQLTVFT